MKKCPYCAESIQDEAIVCRFCGRDLTTTPEPPKSVQKDPTKNSWSVIGYICGFLMFIFEIYWFFRWWGLVGAIAGVMFFPLAVLFPFIYLFMEGFSLFYFGLWAVSLLGLYLGQKAE